MIHLINKSALVAEIERLKNTSLEYGYNTMQKILADSGKDISLRQLQNFIDTLEVKEVDLEKYYHEFLQKEWFGNSHVRTVSEMMDFTAKHFFELGMSASNKAQKGE